MDDRWSEWAYTDNDTLLRHVWVSIYGGTLTRPKPFIHWAHRGGDLRTAMDETFPDCHDMPGWEILTVVPHELVAGPFDSLDAAKAAYLMMVEV